MIAFAFYTIYKKVLINHLKYVDKYLFLASKLQIKSNDPTI